MNYKELRTIENHINNYKSHNIIEKIIEILVNEDIDYNEVIEKINRCKFYFLKSFINPNILINKDIDLDKIHIIKLIYDDNTTDYFKLVYDDKYGKNISYNIDILDNDIKLFIKLDESKYEKLEPAEKLTFNLINELTNEKFIKKLSSAVSPSLLLKDVIDILLNDYTIAENYNFNSVIPLISNTKNTVKSHLNNVNGDNLIILNQFKKDLIIFHIKHGMDNDEANIYVNNISLNKITLYKDIEGFLVTYLNKPNKTVIYTYNENKLNELYPENI